MRRSGLAVTLALGMAGLPWFAGPASAQTRGVAPEHELFRKVAELDAAVFDASDKCDLEKFGAFFADDVEFYHDQAGLTRSRATLVEAVKNNICGKVRRELVPGTLQVHEMKGYGALEIGVHRFHNPPARAEAGGEAQFIHLWHNRDGVWQITRVISYDHRELK
jgi:ketosteroid isomerase-like protein